MDGVAGVETEGEVVPEDEEFGCTGGCWYTTKGQ
jgi:hypothetical protein